jgi:cytochrome c-type biogenesis protein CcmH
MKKRHIYVIWILLAVAIAASLYVGASGGSSGTSVAQRVSQIASQVRCPVCDGLSVEASSAPIAKDLKNTITKDVIGGMTLDQVEQSLVERYGSSILLRPQRSGITLFVWLVPVIVILAGLGVLIRFYYLRSRRKSWVK